ncbi:hypothetical protein [Paraburkholderia sp. J7]|uniref:hypothetical protein n=1 Tax=Paraburkholderia sp. J7 TaxID=2805438 RepID=UPI002AB6129B|nr:hypothetical protein [Paraburkholderia sp. J7]
MDDRLIFTVVIRGVAYSELVSLLAAIRDSRERAGLLKRLGEDGAQLAALAVTGVSGGADNAHEGRPDRRGFDIRLVIRREEFPRLYEVLLQCGTPRARAARFRQLAHEGARRRQAATEPVAARVPVVVSESVSGSERTKSISRLSLGAGGIPKDMLAGWSAGK